MHCLRQGGVGRQDQDHHGRSPLYGHLGIALCVDARIFQSLKPKDGCVFAREYARLVCTPVVLECVDLVDLSRLAGTLVWMAGVCDDYEQ